MVTYKCQLENPLHVIDSRWNGWWDWNNLEYWNASSVFYVYQLSSPCVRVDVYVQAEAISSGNYDVFQQVRQGSLIHCIIPMHFLVSIQYLVPFQYRLNPLPSFNPLHWTQPSVNSSSIHSNTNIDLSNYHYRLWSDLAMHLRGVTVIVAMNDLPLQLGEDWPIGTMY